MRLAFILLMALLFPVVSFAVPKTVILIRHGEKDGDDLSPAGDRRAQALVGWFEDVVAPKYGVPVGIFAFHEKKSGKRARGVETMTPLSRALRLPINSSFEEEDASGLADEILKNQRYDGGLVVVCWEHHNIPDVARALGVTNASKWGNSYDTAWVLNFSDGKVTMKKIGQNLGGN